MSKRRQSTPLFQRHSAIPRPALVRLRLRSLARSLACVVGMPALAGFAPAALAATYTVNNAGYPASGMASNCAASNANTCTLRDAVAAATSGSDTIDFNADMTILLNSTVTLDHNVTIDGTGHAVAVDGNYAVGVFTVNAGTTAQLTSLTIQNGKTAANGAGIYNKGTLALTDSTLSGNKGAIGTFNMGGGLFNMGTATVTGSTLSGNKAASQGGGIFNSGTLTLIKSTLSDNDGGTFGGGLYIALDSPRTTVTDSTFSGNHVIWKGGGIMDAAGFDVTVANSTFDGNHAGLAGGGIANGNLAMTLINSTLSGNYATGGKGGGIYNYGQLTLTNSTLSGNTAATGADLYNGAQSWNGGDRIVTFSNTIVAAGGGCFNRTPLYAYLNEFIDNGGNLDGGTSCGFTLASSKSNATLNLGALANNGGPTQTMLPGAGSDAINFSVCTNAPLVDQRGYLRPDPASIGQPTPCDAGAVEVGSVLSDRLFADGFGPPPFYK